MSSAGESVEREALLERILDEAAARARDGDAPSVEEYAEKYPEIADGIRETLPVLIRLENRATDAESAPARTEEIVPGRTLGDYRLVRLLGRGGMGVVYEADQLSLDRRVALKLLPSASRDVESLKRRFELEARTAARLLHPHIVAVHEFGEVDGFAFYAMQFVDGMNLDAVVRSLRKGPDPRDGVSVVAAGAEADGDGLSGALASALRLGVIDGRAQRVSTENGSESWGSSGTGVVASSRSRLSSSSSTAAPADGRTHGRDLDAPGARYFAGVARIGSIVADALSHAHAAGVLHRDIKPSNLLLDRQGKVWIADFGLAKLEDGEGLTQSGDAVGTLRYMGPERFRGWSDPRSDVYSLGATLFELVSLEPPFNEFDRAGLVKRIVEGDPPRPRTIDSRIPRDLETIILKCLEKEPARRYASAADLRDDLERFLEGHPVRARLATPLERAWLFVRRNPVISSLTAAFLVVAVVATFSALRLNETASELRQTAGALEEEKDRALEHLWESRVAQARASLDSIDASSRKKALEVIAEAAAYRPSLELRNVAIAWLGGIGIEVESEFQTPARGHPIVSPTGELMALSDGGDVVLRDLATGSERRMQGVEEREVWGLDFSPSGEYIVRRCRNDRLELLRVADGRSLGVLGRSAARLSFHPEEPLAAVMDSGTVRLRDLATGEDVPLPAWAESASWLAFAPQGDRVALVDRSRRFLTVHDATSGKQIHRFPRPPSRFNDPLEGVVWHPGGRIIAAGWRPLVVWDLDGGVTRLVNEDVFLQRIAFSPDGEFLGAAAWPWCASSRIFEARSGRLLSKLRGELTGFDPGSPGILLRDGRSMRTARIERDQSHRVFEVADASLDANFWVAFDPSGRWLAAARDTGVYLWDVARSRLVARLLVGKTVWIEWSEDGSELLTAGASGTWRWRWETTSRGIAVGPPRQVSHRVVWGATRAPGGRIVTSKAPRLDVHHLSQPESDFTLASFPGATFPTVSRDGKYLACASVGSSGEVRVWDLQSRHVVHREVSNSALRPLFVGESGLLLLGEGGSRLLESGSWKVVGRYRWDALVAAAGGDLVIAGRSTASQSSPISASVVTLLDPDRWPTPLAEFEIRSQVMSLAVSLDGRFLAAGTIEGGPVHLWRLDTLRPRLRELGLDWEPPLEDTRPPAPAEDLAIAVDLGDFEPARRLEIELDEAEEALDKAPDDIFVRLRFADASRKLGLWDQALSEYERVLETSFTHLHANYVAWWYALAPEKYRNLERGLELVTRSLELKPDFWIAYNTLGVVQLRRNAWAEARRAFETSRENRWPRDESLLFDYLPLAITLHRLGEEATARVIFDFARQTATLHQKIRPDLRAGLRDLYVETASELNDNRPIPTSLKE